MLSHTHPVHIVSHPSYEQEPVADSVKGLVPVYIPQDTSRFTSDKRLLSDVAWGAVA